MKTEFPQETWRPEGASSFPRGNPVSITGNLEIWKILSGPSSPFPKGHRPVFFQISYCTKLPNYQTTKQANYQTIKLQTTKLLNYQLLNYQTTKLLNSKLPNY